MPATEIRCKVTSHRFITPTVYELIFESEPAFQFEAGQFISCVIPGAGPKGRDLRRAYSIASSPEKKAVELCIKLVDGGPGSTFLNKLRDGDQFRGYAPYGDFTYELKPERHAFFISTGTGIAPFRAMVMSDYFKANLPKSARCIIGVRTEDELMYKPDFDAAKIEWIPAVSQPVGEWKGFKGRVTDYIRALGEDYPWLETEFYLCGNGAMITEVKELLAAKGVQKDSIHQEKYY
jgi:CDP-4-dehydro-6-deoxyglucose reductase, E3